MIKVNHILVPTDYADGVSNAYAHAYHLAERYKATIHILSVNEQKTLNLGDMPDGGIIDEHDIAEQLRLPRAVKAAGSGAQDAVEVVHAVRNAASVAGSILEYANAHDIDLIVMGTHKRNSLARTLNGKVTEDVMRLAACPVLTIREGVTLRTELNIRRILVPVDFSYASPTLLAHAKALAAAYDAELDLLYVLEEPLVPMVYNTDRFFSAVPKVAPRARKALEVLAKHVEGPDVPFQSHVLTGRPARAILDFAEAQHIDLIMMAPHGRADIQRRLLGSVAEQVIRDASCLVRTVKPLGKSLVFNAPVDQEDKVAA